MRDFKTALNCSSKAHHRSGSTGPHGLPRQTRAELLIALLNALIMRGGKRVWRRSILLSIFISAATHQRTLIIFMNSAATDAEEAAELRFGCPPPPRSWRGGEWGWLYGTCVSVCLCARSLWISMMLPR